jgi:hypothetical protein
MAGFEETFMTIKDRRALRLRRVRAWSIAAMSIVLLQAAVGMNLPARADEPARPQAVDVSLITCGEFLRMPLAQALVLVGWIGGFYAGRINDTKVEMQAFVGETERIISLCGENQSARLMTLVDEDLRREQGLGDGADGLPPSP